MRSLRSLRRARPWSPASGGDRAWLAFIGLGDQTRASWGTILQDAKNFASTSWWYALFPGLAISLTILGFILLGEALREGLDPRTPPETP